MKPRQFKCPVCQEIRERGVYVRVQFHALKGWKLKVCKRAACSEIAQGGKLWAEDPVYRWEGRTELARERAVAAMRRRSKGTA